MASISKRGARWQVRWRSVQVTVDESGHSYKRTKDRQRSCPTRAAAKILARQIEEAVAQGENWEEKRLRPTATLRGLALGYVRAAQEAGAPISTQRFRSAMIGAFLDYLCAGDSGDAGEYRAVAELSLSLLEVYSRTLPAGTEGQRSTRYRKIMEVERMWAWGHDRPEAFPAVPYPRRFTGKGADKLSRPLPVVATASPTWRDVDAMIAELRTPWHRRAALVARYTALRASQLTGLVWENIDLRRMVLYIPAGQAGAKKGRSRVIPLAPPLVEELQTWASEAGGEPTGLVFPRRYKKGGATNPAPYRGDALAAPFGRAWRKAGVPENKWGVGPGRSKGRPTHAFRAAVRTQLIRLGVEEAIVLHLVGHSQGHTAAAYVPVDTPEESPY